MNYFTDTETLNLLTAKTELQKAIDHEEFVLYYQPQIKIETGELSGIEALVRWNHPDFGLISPDKFIPLAEQTYLIGSLGQWILNTACCQNQAWQNLGLPPLIISVNLSAYQLESPSLGKIVKKVLKETRLEPQWLEFEITEEAILSNPEMAHQALLDLKQIGVHLSLDDFGSGYSSLSYLSKFPFGTLKIAQSCIENLTEDYQAISLISVIISLGKMLDMRVIAEGVETQKQLDILRNLDCREVQGYLLSQPLTQEEATSFLALYYGF
ncbi:EAL domain-containing protein [Crocosphaera sp. UHCC 0190]|uniref:putative bifunctional diguanylate cyclase/phosphodiesterase n=1 Tax=Crocosphaera sp. UHCC 0190 TaxID=3110246 RepID=UPI002B1F75C4|nr:EAL domain-containing protein [Crocosphaera sp. UHCC 0190]MEA5510577.1 EAL domain-containing protein [Crocosphaera sp. UHCC 0190]